MRCRGGKDFRERWGGNAVSEKEGILGPRERVVGTRMRCRGRKVSPGGGGGDEVSEKEGIPGRGGGVGYPVEATPLPPPLPPLTSSPSTLLLRVRVLHGGLGPGPDLRVRYGGSWGKGGEGTRGREGMTREQITCLRLKSAQDYSTPIGPHP